MRGMVPDWARGVKGGDGSRDPPRGRVRESRIEEGSPIAPSQIQRRPNEPSVSADWRRMLRSVPVWSSRWRGTTAVKVPPAGVALAN